MGKWLNKFMGNTPKVTSDKSDNNTPQLDLSLLSLPYQSTFDENLGNIDRTSSDKSDNNDLKPDLSLLSPPSQGVFDKNSLLYNFQERVAIAEVDGNKNPLQAHRIAYLDTFLTLLFEITALDSQRDWLVQRVQSALNNFEAQQFPTRH